MVEVNTVSVQRVWSCSSVPFSSPIGWGCSCPTSAIADTEPWHAQFKTVTRLVYGKAEDHYRAPDVAKRRQ